MGLIRFLLALSVLIVHSSPVFGLTILPGYLAVQIFYVISGFYMTYIYTEKYAKTSRPYFNFYTNRFLRLYPLYLFIISLTIVLSFVYGFWLGSFGKLQYYFNEYTTQPESLTALIIIAVSNITLIGQDLMTFFGINASGELYFLGLTSDLTIQEYLLIQIAWTVAVEMFFYLLTPFIVIKNINYILLFIFLILALRLILYSVFNVQGGFSIYRFAPTEIFWFLLGTLSFKLYKSNYFPDRRFGSWLLVLFLAVLFTHKYYQIDYVLFILIVICMPAVFYKFSTNAIDKFFGELTYPIYISHCFFLLIISANRFPKHYGTGLPLFAMTLVFSLFIHHFFAKPIEKYRAKRVDIIN